jgi:hypothetical protein
VKSLPGDDVPVPYYIVGDNAFNPEKLVVCVDQGHEDNGGEALIVSVHRASIPRTGGDRQMLAIQSTTAVWKLPSLRRVEGRIEKDTWYRKSLPPSLKLSITLRHLACGDNYPSLSYNFRVAPNTISLIINEVCDAIKAEFAAEVIQ